MSPVNPTRAASVRARLRNVAKTQGVDFQQVLCNLPPFTFYSDRSTILRGELKACYFRLQGNGRDGPGYVIDAADVAGRALPNFSRLQRKRQCTKVVILERKVWCWMSGAGWS